MYTVVARLGFKRRATALLKSNLIRSIDFGTAEVRPFETSLNQGLRPALSQRRQRRNAKKQVLYSAKQR